MAKINKLQVKTNNYLMKLPAATVENDDDGDGDGDVYIYVKVITSTCLVFSSFR